MIVNIRGLSGSGKSTAVKKIIDLYSSQEILIARKQRALVTRLYDVQELNQCVVIGPYDNKNQTLGCDTIAYNEQVKLLVNYFDDLGYDVLFEGMMLSSNHTLITDLAKNKNVSVLYLDTPLDVVIKQRKQRALEKNRDSNYKHDVSVMNKDQIITKSLEIIKSNIGDNLHYVTQDNIVLRYLEIIFNQDLRNIKTENYQDRFDLMCRYDTMSSDRNAKKTLPGDLFDVI